jgi:hypothetical protein
MQMLGTVDRILARGAEHCREHGHSLDELAEARLHHDMLPLRFQIASTVTHSLGAIEGVRKGSFSPASKSGLSYPELQKAVVEANEALGKITAADLNGLEGREVFFQTGDIKLPFSAEDFLLSFSLPNFYFHTSIAYGILRSKGVALGKRDFLGRMRIKR